MKERRQLELPDRRVHTYEELAKKLDDHTEAVEKRLHRFFAKALAIFAIIGISSAVALFGFSIVLSEVKETRKEFVRSTCEAQNKRHDRTMAKFKAASKESIKRNPEFADEIRAAEQDNLDIIDSLAPKQDCEKLSNVSVGDAAPPPPVITTRTGE